MIIKPSAAIVPRISGTISNAGSRIDLMNGIESGKGPKETQKRANYKIVLDVAIECLGYTYRAASDAHIDWQTLEESIGFSPRVLDQITYCYRIRTRAVTGHNAGVIVFAE